MGAMASQITSLTVVYSTVYSDADQRKHQSSASLGFVCGIHRWPVNSPHKWPVRRKLFPFDDVIMFHSTLLILKKILTLWSWFWAEEASKDIKTFYLFSKYISYKWNTRKLLVKMSHLFDYLSKKHGEYVVFVLAASYYDLCLILCDKYHTSLSLIYIVCNIKLMHILEDRGPTIAVGDTVFTYLDAPSVASLHTCTVIPTGVINNPNVQCSTPVTGR